MFGYMNFNVKYYILSQIFYKKIEWLSISLSVLISETPNSRLAKAQPAHPLTTSLHIALQSFHKFRKHLGVGRWSEKCFFCLLRVRKMFTLG